MKPLSAFRVELIKAAAELNYVFGLKPSIDINDESISEETLINLINEGLRNQLKGDTFTKSTLETFDKIRTWKRGDIVIDLVKGQTLTIHVKEGSLVLLPTKEDPKKFIGVLKGEYNEFCLRVD